MRLFSNAHYPFIGKRKVAYALSGSLIVVAICAMIANLILIGSWQHYGVDFTGGSLIQVRFDVPMTAGELRDALGGANAPEITRFGSDNDFTIRAPVMENATVDEVRQGLEQELTAAFGSGTRSFSWTAKCR